MRCLLLLLLVVVVVCSGLDFGEVPLPFEEERIKRWFRIEGALPASPRRFSLMSAETMRDLVTRGEPFIVSDATRDWIGPWTPQFFAERFPNQNLTAFTNAAGKRESIVRRFADVDFSSEIFHPEAERRSSTPTLSSWYWPVIGVEQNNTADDEAVALLLNKTKLPYFFEQCDDNRKMYHDRIELFFGKAESGVLPHSDPVCESIVSVQLQGRKKWRLAMSVNMELLLATYPDWPKATREVSTTLEARMADEHPIFEFELGPGEALVFPPGMIHSTKVPSDVESVSTSMSLQMAHPMAVLYAREFVTSVAADSNPGRCFLREWNSLLYGSSTPNLNFDEAATEEYKERTFAHLDVDGNGSLDPNELKERLDDMSQEANMTHRAEMFLLLHDHDKDGVVTRAELEGHSWRPFLAEVTILKVLHRLDKNGDGSVSKEEFERVFSELNWENFVEGTDMDVIPYLSELNAAKFPQLFPVRHSFDLIRMPKKSELIAEIPEDYFLTFRMLKEGVEYFGPRSGTGLGFLQFHKEGLLFAGPFENFTRHGCGVTCCVKSEGNNDDDEAEEVIVDHEFEHDAQFEPVQAQNASIASCAIEVAVASGSGARLLVRSALSGLALLALDRRAAALFVGEMRAGRRLGEGVFRDAEGRLFRQTWTEGEDTLLTSLSLPQE